MVDESGTQEIYQGGDNFKIPAIIGFLPMSQKTCLYLKLRLWFNFLMIGTIYFLVSLNKHRIILFEIKAEKHENYGPYHLKFMIKALF